MSSIFNGISEAKRSPEPDYDDPSWDEKVDSVGQKAKQAEVLKSQGKEPKTRWNPETKKYYVDFSDVDESVGLPYPGTYEETDDMFKGSGQRRIGTLTTENDDPFRGTGGRFNKGDDERHDRDPSDWYIVKDGKLFAASIYPRQVQQAIAQGFSRTKAEARAKASSEGVAEAKGKLTYTPEPTEYGVFPDSKNEFVKTFLSRDLALAHIKKFGGKLIVLDQHGRRMKEGVAEGLKDKLAGAALAGSMAMSGAPAHAGFGADLAGAAAKGLGSGMASTAMAPLLYKEKNAADKAFAEQIPDEADKAKYLKGLKYIISSRDLANAGSTGMIQNTADEIQFKKFKQRFAKKYDIQIPTNEGVAEGSRKTITPEQMIRDAVEAYKREAAKENPNLSILDSIRTNINDIKREIERKQGVSEEWSQKYKSSINCSHPKGFSQKAHCAGKKKHNESIEMEMTCPDCGMCQTHGDHSHDNLEEACWKGYHKDGMKTMFGKRYPNCVKNEDVAEGLNNGQGPSVDEILYHLTRAYRSLQKRNDFYQDFSIITHIYETLRSYLKDGDLEGFHSSYERMLSRYPDASVELFDAMFQSAGLPSDTGTIEQFLDKCSQQGVEEGLGKDIKRLATGKDVKSRAGQEIAKSQDASMKGDTKTSKKHFDRYDKLDKLANKGVAEGSEGSWVVYDGAKIKRFKTHEGAKAYAEKNGGKVASSEYYHDKIQQKQGVAEGSLDEVSQDTARSYAQKAHASQKDLINQTHRKGADTDALNKKIKNRQQGMDRAHTDKRYYKDEQGVAEGSEYKSRHAHKQEQDKAYADYRTKHNTSRMALMTRAEFAKDQRERAAKKKQGVAEGEVKQFPKKHPYELLTNCPKCGGPLQGGKDEKGRLKLCMPCMNIYRAPNQQGVAEGSDKSLLKQVKPHCRNAWVSNGRLWVECDPLQVKKIADLLNTKPISGSVMGEYAFDLPQGVEEEKQRLDPKCWTGKHKEGTKMKGGVRVNNCVANESAIMKGIK